VPVPIVPPRSTNGKIHSWGPRARIGPNAPPVKKAPRHRCPSIVFVPIAITGSTKRPPISRGRRVLLGPPVPPVKKVPHQARPPIVRAAIAVVASTKAKVGLLELLVPRGAPARLGKK
jgi:hypothetical protein